MPASFDVAVPVRTAPDALADLPLVTIAWRALRADYQQRVRQQEEQDSRFKNLLMALIRIADQAVQLKRPTAGPAPDAADAAANERLAQAADALFNVLSDVGLTVIAPQGQAYCGDLTEVLENCAQVPGLVADVPRVAEVMVPAILQDSRIVRMGKAVIAVPPSADAAAGGEPEQSPEV